MTELQTDLHIHTTASDGVLAPSQVVFRAKERGLTCLAVSDHDTIAGVAEAQRAAAQAGIILVPAVELSTGGEQEIHILGYGVPQGDARLEAFLSRMAQERMTRADRMLEKLAALGMPLTKNEIPVKSGGVIGRPQIARAMIARGYAASVQEAFDRYRAIAQPARRAGAGASRLTWLAGRCASADTAGMDRSRASGHGGLSSRPSA